MTINSLLRVCLQANYGSAFPYSLDQRQRRPNIVVRLSVMELVDGNLEPRIGFRKQLWPLTRFAIVRVEEDFHS